MKRFREKLEDILKKEKMFLDDEGELDYIKLKASAEELDVKLLNLLIQNSEFKKEFFHQVDNYLVFKVKEFNFF